MHSSRRIPAVLASAACLLVAACGSDDSGGKSKTSSSSSSKAPAGDVRGKVFGLDYGLTNSPIYESVLRPAKRRAQELGVRLKTTSSDAVCEKQVNNLDNLIASGVDTLTFLGLCGKGDAYKPVIRRAHAKQVKVVTYSFSDPEADGSILFDDKQGAELLAADVTAWIKKTFDGDYSGFRFAMLPCSFAPPSIQQRTAITSAAITELTGKKPLTKDCASDPAAAKAAVDSFLAKEPRLNVVIGFIDAAALGAVQSFRSHPGIDRSKVYVGAMDGQREAVKLLAEGGAGGIFRATAALDLEQDGRAVVDMPANALTGKGPTSTLLRYTLLRVSDRAAAQQWYDRVFARYGG